MKPFSIIVAVDSCFGIAKNGLIPWHCREDMLHFKKITVGNIVIMSYSTWNSIKAKPLSDRINLIISPSGNTVSEVQCFLSLDDALKWCYDNEPTKRAIVIGGGKLYRHSLQHNLCEEIHLSRISGDYSCDTHLELNHVNDGSDVCLGEFCAMFSTKFVIKTQDSHTDWSYTRYTRINPDEQQYLNLIKSIIATGCLKTDRTSVGTLSTFGNQAVYDLSNNRLPLFTTKKMFWRGVVEELMWMIKGCTDSKVLEAKGVNIWKGNSTREFLDQRGLYDYEEGDCGKIYGAQWRHYGAQYRGCHADYTGEGIDQLKTAISMIKNDPTSRRILVSAWNPSDLDKMCLPPCHVMMQFYVDTNNKTLSCMMTQRSCDMGLGVPFNVASYSLLTILISHICGLKPGKFVHNMGDTHVYCNHIDGLQEQLKQTPYPFPTVYISKKSEDIDSYSSEDIQLINYNHCPPIKLKMAV